MPMPFFGGGGGGEVFGGGGVKGVYYGICASRESCLT